jgi:glycosyltransferase involved in cell wall biosynthesis
MVPEKGLCELVQAVGELRRLHGIDAHLLMVGGRLASDPPSGIAELDAMMAEAAHAGWLQATGLVPDPAPFLGLMHTFCLPSYREGLPVALMEAMSAGLPCVATRIRGCRELITHEESGLLIEPRDASGLASALERIARNPLLAQQLGDAARRRITESFSFEAWIERIGTVYALDAAAIQSIREASDKSASS